MKSIQSTKAMRTAPMAAALLAGSMLLPSLASALTSGTAANTTVRNLVTVSFADAANVAQTDVVAEVDVSVLLVEAAPTLTLLTANAVTIAPNGTATYDYTLQTNANGPDSYTVSTTESLDETLAPGASSSNHGPYTLGATSIVSAVDNGGNNWTLTVASDATGGGDINGLAQGNTVVIDGVACTIDAGGSWADNGTSAPDLGVTPISNSSMDVSCAAVVTPAAGELVQERVSFTVTVTPGVYDGPADNSIVTDTSATDGTNASGTSTVTTTVRGVNLVVNKYVRCPTPSASCTNPGAADITVGTTDYYASGVQAAPGQVLEYLISVNNPAGNSDAKDVVIEDPLPAFTSLVAASAKILDSTGAVLAEDDGLGVGGCDLTTNGDACRLIGNTVTLYPGSTALLLGQDNDNTVPDTNATSPGGILPGNTTVYGVFQVTVN